MSASLHMSCLLHSTCHVCSTPHVMSAPLHMSCLLHSTCHVCSTLHAMSAPLHMSCLLHSTYHVHISFSLAQGERIGNTWTGDHARLVALQAVIQEIKDKDLLSQVKESGEVLLKGLCSLSVRLQLIHTQIYNIHVWEF